MHRSRATGVPGATQIGRTRRSLAGTTCACYAGRRTAQGLRRPLSASAGGGASLPDVEFMTSSRHRAEGVASSASVSLTLDGHEPHRIAPFIRGMREVLRGSLSRPLVTFVASTRHLTVRGAERPAPYAVLSAIACRHFRDGTRHLFDVRP